MKVVTYTLALVLWVCCLSAQGQVLCPVYTDEQTDRLQAAYVYGSERGYPLTLPAIVIDESFVGDRIVRYNPNDPSTGITQIQFKTLQYLSGKSRWEAVLEAERLLTDDELAFYYAIAKLDSIKSQSYRYKWKRYNGSGPSAVRYANRMHALTKMLMFCQDWSTQSAKYAYN